MSAAVIYEVVLDVDAALLPEFGPWLREHGVARFGDRFTATRRILQAADGY